MSEADKAFLLVGIVGQLGLAGYIFWSIRQGYISVQAERIYRAKNPARFRFVLRSYIVGAVAIAMFTVYFALKPSN